MSPLCVSVPPSEVEILTQSGNALEDERYNEGTDLSLVCSVLGGNILCIDQINSPQKRSVIETYLLSLRSAHISSRSNLESANIKIDLQGLSQTPEQGLAITQTKCDKNVTMFFSVTGRPRPRVTWLLNNQSLASRYSEDLVTEDGHVRQRPDNVA